MLQTIAGIINQRFIIKKRIIESKKIQPVLRSVPDSARATEYEKFGMYSPRKVNCCGVSNPLVFKSVHFTVYTALDESAPHDLLLSSRISILSNSQDTNPSKKTATHPK